ncbi:MAG: sn-glycerol-3-phosphate ABC transporter ATP-binding protein UgpC [Myxococcota bacterium]
MAIVSFEHVRKDFGTVTVVHDFNLQVADGELVVLVGGSGCGKSTILRMLAGLESVTSGTVHIGERDVTQLPPRERDVAMVFQDYALYPHLTARQNISLGLRLRKVPKEEIDRRVGWAAEILELQPFLDRKPKQMSGGQRQRIAMGRAIVREPAVFLFDEPLSNLDAHLRGQMRHEIARMQRRVGTTTLYVTHDQVEAMTLGDRLVVLEGGRIQQVGRPIDVYRAPANRFVAGFIGTPPMNFLEGHLERDLDGLVFVSEAVRIPLPAERRPDPTEHSGEAVMLGVRPEHLALAAAPEPGTITGQLVLAEVLGATTHLHVEVGGRRLIATVPSGSSQAESEPLTLSVERRRLHFFAADGSSLLPNHHDPGNDVPGSAPASNT